MISKNLQFLVTTAQLWFHTSIKQLSMERVLLVLLITNGFNKPSFLQYNKEVLKSSKQENFQVLLVLQMLQ